MLVAAGAILLALAPAGANGATDSPDSPLIPVPEIALRAEHVSTLLRNLGASLAPSPEYEQIKGRLPAASRELRDRFEWTARVLEASAAPATHESLTDLWQSIRRERLTWNGTLARRATQLDDTLGRLSTARDAWTRTREAAERSGTPAPVLDRITAILDEIGQSQARGDQRRLAVLLLQNQIAGEVAQCDEALARIAQRQSQLLDRLFVPSTPPIWNQPLARGSLAKLAPPAGEALGLELMLLRGYIETHGGRIALHVLMIIALSALLMSARARADRWRTEDPSLRALAKAVRRPVSSALVLGLLASPLVHPELPRIVRALLEVAVLVPVLRIAAQFVPRRVTGGLSLLAGLFALDLVRYSLSVEQAIAQTLLLIEMLGALACVTALRRGWRFRDASESAPDRGAGPLLRMGARAAQGVFGFAFGAVALGYVALGRLVGVGLLRASYFALATWVLLLLVDSIVAYALETPLLRRVHLVERHPALVRFWSRRILRVVAVAVWLLTTLESLDLFEPAKAAAAGLLGARWSWGNVSVSLGDVVLFAVTVWLAFMVSRLTRFVLEEDLYPRLPLAQGVPYAVSSLLHYGILLAGFLLATVGLGVDLTHVTILASAFGVGIGFGLQNIVNNFVSGIVLLVERPVKVGDSVEIEDATGTIKRIGMRSSVVRTEEGAEVIVPNSKLIANTVTNWTLSDRLRRITLPVSVAPGTDPEQVLDVLRKTAGGQPGVADEPAPVALFVGFGRSALTFKLQVWTDQSRAGAEVRSELGVAVHAALRAAKIDVPVLSELLVPRAGSPPGPTENRVE